MRCLRLRKITSVSHFILLDSSPPNQLVQKRDCRTSTAPRCMTPHEHCGVPPPLRFSAILTRFKRRREHSCFALSFIFGVTSVKGIHTFPRWLEVHYGYHGLAEDQEALNMVDDFQVAERSPHELDEIDRRSVSQCFECSFERQSPLALQRHHAD